VNDKDNNEHKVCPGCGGAGVWETECCNGASGCSCKGLPVYMGTCRVCGGSGFVGKIYDERANLKAIRGLCYVGSGPQK